MNRPPHKFVDRVKTIRTLAISISRNCIDMVIKNKIDNHIKQKVGGYQEIFDFVGSVLITYTIKQLMKRK